MASLRYWCIISWDQYSYIYIDLQKADLAVGSISVLPEREMVVDFTVPFYDLVGHAILMQSQNKQTHIFKVNIKQRSPSCCISNIY